MSGTFSSLIIRLLYTFCIYILSQGRNIIHLAAVPAEFIPCIVRLYLPGDTTVWLYLPGDTTVWLFLAEDTTQGALSGRCVVWLFLPENAIIWLFLARNTTKFVFI